MTLGAFEFWLLSTLTSTATLGLIAWLCRTWLAGWLTAAAQHSFDVKLEALRAEFRTKEQQLEANLRAKESQIDALRSGVLSSVAARHNALSVKRLEAVDLLWSSVMEINSFSPALKMMQSIKFEAASEGIEQDKNSQQFFRTINKTFGRPIEKLETQAEKVRPYLPEFVWALYQAYLTVHVLAITKLNLLSQGLDGRKFFNFKVGDDLLKTALPHHAALIDEFGDGAHAAIVGELRDKILAQLRESLVHPDDAKRHMDEAAALIQLTNKINSELATAPGVSTENT